MLILADTSVFVRSAEPGHRDHNIAVNALRVLRKDGHTLCVLPQVHYEFWVVATRPIQQNGLEMTAAEAEAELLHMAPPLFRFFRDERAIYTEWRGLVRLHDVKGKPAHDARLVAAMQRHGLRHILTFNVEDFKRYPRIEVLDPAQIPTS
jgi:predicted nucleic acid-binding protein